MAAYSRAIIRERTASKNMAEDLPRAQGRQGLTVAAGPAGGDADHVDLCRMLKLNPAGRHAASSPSPKEPPLPVSYFERMGLLEDRRDDERH